METQSVKRAALAGIFEATDATIHDAARVHSISWRASHEHFCERAFVNAHDERAQLEHLKAETRAGKRLFIYFGRGEALGVVTVLESESLIENLYVLPGVQNHGIGMALLHFAMSVCSGAPRLWILDNNARARALYEAHGFALTGRAQVIAGALNELEMRFGAK